MPDAPMKTAHDIAQYLLSLTDPCQRETLSYMAVQRLLYYCQGYSLAINGRPLFSDKIVNGQYGPMVMDIFERYFEGSENKMLPFPKGLDLDSFDEEDRTLMHRVFASYGQFAGWRLAQMSQEEQPWRETARNAVIPHSLLKRFFMTQTEEVEEEEAEPAKAV